MRYNPLVAHRTDFGEWRWLGGGKPPPNLPRQMTIVYPDNRPPRVLYAGTLGEFSRAPLAALLAAGIEVCGVVVPAAPRHPPIARLAPERSRSLLPIANPYLTPNIVHMAWERDIAAFAIGRGGEAATVATLAELRPAVACVACFPWRIPAALLQLPPLGWLNVHPSLLPAYRGPAPLFWAFRGGETAIGVTIHFMDQQLDAGDIAAQAPLVLPDGISGVEADRSCAALGGRLLVETLQGLQRGTLARRKQPEGGAYYGWPSPDDWTISTAWSARRAFNFMRGTDDWGQRYLVEAGGARLALTAALSYAAEETLGRSFVRAGGEVAIQFTPGVLRAVSAGAFIR
jgi:methionyl-tRNA formyltransferase